MLSSSSSDFAQQSKGGRVNKIGLVLSAGAFFDAIKISLHIYFPEWLAGGQSKDLSMSHAANLVLGELVIL